MKSYNSIDYTISDIAYYHNSLPKYIIKTPFNQPFSPITCNDYTTSYQNLFIPPNNINTLPEYIPWCKSLLDINLNDFFNIWFHIKNIDDINTINAQVLEYETKEKTQVNYSNIHIPRSLASFKRTYSLKYNKRNIFRELDKTISSEHYLTSSTKTFKLSSKYNINKVFNSIQLTSNFPVCKYHTYIKLDESIDNISRLNTNLTEKIYEYRINKSNEITIFYLKDTNKPDIPTSYIPIRIYKHHKTKEININFEIEERVWNLIKQEFINLFVDIDIGNEENTFKKGIFFFKNEQYNHSIMSHICLLHSDPFIIKNEKSSVNTLKFKLTYNTNIDITLRNKNIRGNEKFKELKTYPSNTKYIEVYFTKVLHEGDICNIKKYFGKLLTLHNNLQTSLAKIYKSVITNFSLLEDTSNEAEVKGKDLSNYVMTNLTKLPKDNYLYSKDCQKTKSQNKQPIMINDPPELSNYMGEKGVFKDYFKIDVNNRLYMNWPKERDDTYFYCDEDVNKDFDKVSINMNQVPCCFKKFQKPKNEKYFLTGQDVNIKQLTDTLKENLYSNYNINIPKKLSYNLLSYYSIIEPNNTIKNLDSQSNLINPTSSNIEYKLLSLEYQNNINMIVFNEKGFLITPKSHPYIHNIYFKTNYTKNIVLIRKDDKFAKIDIEYDTINNILKQRHNTYILNNNIEPYNLPNLKLIKSQFIDVFGKCRILKLNNSLFCQTLLPPLPIEIKKLKDKDNLIKVSNIDDVMNFINGEGTDISKVSQYIEGLVCREISVVYKGIELIFNVVGEMLKGVDTYEERKIIYSNTNNFKTFSKLKNLTHKLKEATIKSKSSIKNIVEKQGITEEKDLIIRKLEYFKNIFVARKVDYQSYIENIHDISSYKKFVNQRILYISKHIIPKNTELKIQTISKDLVDIFIEPYIVFFNNNLYIAQDTKSVENSLYISENWNLKQFNYKYNNKFSKGSDSFIIYEYDGNIKLQKGNGLNKIILINPKQGEYKYITLLQI
jgi:hypothetical protein